MDKIAEQINTTLFEVFGLCPEYKVAWTDSEWVEFYDPKIYFQPDFRKPVLYPSSGVVRLHLDEHKTLLHNGLCVTANFAVAHLTRIIYLRVIKTSSGDYYSKVSTNG